MKRTGLTLAVIALVIDTAAISAGLVWAYLIRADGTELFQWPLNSYLKFVAWLMPVWILLLASQGLYKPSEPPQLWRAIGLGLIGLLSGWAVLIIVLYLWRSPESQVFPRLIIVYGVFLTSALLVIGRILFDGLVNYFYRSGLGLTNAVILSGDNCQNFVENLRSDWASGRKVVEVIEDDYLNRLKSISSRVDEVILCDQKITDEQALEILGYCEERGLSFITVASLMSLRSTNIESTVMAGAVVLRFKRTPLEGWGRVYKRMLDLLLVVPAIILLSPILLIAALLVKLSSPGPVIFRHQRVGQDGRTFYIHKFRSMYEDADRRFQQFDGWSAEEDSDPRITPVGRILRRTNLDELPQLYDVLIGTMSLVGPRPEQPKYVKKFADEIPDYLKRHHVKSGLTGWAQINGWRGNTSISERVKYDLYYIENWSIWFDLRIILGTIVYIFRQAFSR